MSSALQKLLKRPSSLAFLRYLLRASNSEHSLSRTIRVPYICPYNPRYRSNTTEAGKVTIETTSPWAVASGVDIELYTPQSIEILPKNGSASGLQLSTEPVPFRSWKAHKSPKAWLAYLRTIEELEFQSDLDPTSDSSGKFVDDPRFINDFGLWVHLLEYRRSQYGDAGVITFWEAIRRRGLELPTQGIIASKLWSIFLGTGFGKKLMLEDVCQYADELYDKRGRHWSQLYMKIVRYMILNEEYDSVVEWHERLIDRHPPGTIAFCNLVRKVVLQGGDLEALKLLYESDFYKHRKIPTYQEIIPILLQRRDFLAAKQWHFFLMQHGDHPLNKEVVEPLIKHFKAIDPDTAVELRDSLVFTRNRRANTVPDRVEKNEFISREMMNIVHGKAFGIEPKKYSDQLGARWFATTWISIDLAITTVHALGVKAIGPLSLQAIALREADALAVVGRIEQLKQLGISTGKSMFSKAVEYFARNKEIEYFDGLIRSDQHPESYEDMQLQDKFLAAYGRAEDWAQYRLTAAVMAIGSFELHTGSYNIMQRANISRGDRVAFFQMLEEMRVQRIAFTKETIFVIIAHFLPMRIRGQNPDETPKSLEDLKTIISVLISIIKSGSYVPPYAWCEIIRRLGMLGWLDDLEKLCVQLTALYKPNYTIPQIPVKASSIMMATNDFRFSHQRLSATHPKVHPFQIIFSNSIQRQIVEMAFRHQPLRPSTKTTTLEELVERSASHYTRGVKLLRRLQDEGVYIDMVQIRRGIRDRFAILFHPRKPRTAWDNRLRLSNVASLEDMVTQLNKAWGANIWSD